MNRSAFFRSALALLLCLTMVLSFVPMQAAAAEEPAAQAYDCQKDGHDYEAVKFKGNCQQYAHTTYTCKACGDSYDVYPDELYSDWQTEKPDVDASLIQSKQQYRTSRFETVTSYNTAIEGYELVSSRWVATNTHTVSYVESWPEGFQKTHELYTKYDKSALKIEPSESNTRKTEITSDEIVGYLYYHWCYAGYPYTVAVGDATYNRFHAYYSTKTPAEANDYDVSDDSYRIDDATACTDSVWYFCVPVYDQVSTDYRKEFTYGAWSNFSDWSDTEATGSDTVKVGTRTVYRYLKAEKGDHAYDSVTTPATCTAPGKTVYTCSLCKHSYTEDLPQTGHSYKDGKCTACGNAEPTYYLIGYIDGANYGCEEDYQNMGQYKFADGKLVATFKEDSYVFVKTEGNGAWYMSDIYVTEDTATFYNTNTGVGEKMKVPGGVELTFTLKYNSDDTLTLSVTGGTCTHKYEQTVVTAPTCTKGGQAKYTCSKCGDSYTEALDALEHDYRRGICCHCGLEDKTYVTPNYYLVGYINGVDYGSMDDYENRGEFRFEEGKLVINCTQDSYVFIKTEGNTAWYMTDEYCTDTSAVLYDTRDGAHEKMFIPAYMEVTFTLKETEDNTLALSYVAVPCKHIFDDEVVVPGDCMNDGLLLRTCRICTATAEKPIVAKGHDYKSKVTKEPGCETPGTMTYTCANCGNSYTGQISATGHSYQSKVTKPGCETPGYTTYTCANCGDEYMDDNVPALGHNYKAENTRVPTCETAGVMTYTCSGCGDVYTQTMEAIGHNYISEATKPTCEEKGFTTHTCTICGHVYTDAELPALGHTYVNGKCSICGESSEPAYYLFGFINGANYACDDDYENMGEYRFKNGKLVATFKEDSYIGVKLEGNASWYMTEKYTTTTTATFKNTETGVSEKMMIPGGKEITFTLTVNGDDTLTLSYTAAPCTHSYTSAVTTKPTCEKPGVKTFTCTKCGASYTETVNALGHHYNAVVTKPTCTEQGFTTFTCADCKATYTDKLVPATGHSLKTEITKEPGCETTGTKTITCINCDYSTTEKIEATGHSYETTLVKPGCETEGYTLHTCACGDSYKENIVDALGHSFVNGTCTACGASEKGEKFVPVTTPEQVLRGGKFIIVAQTADGPRAMSTTLASGKFAGVEVTVTNNAIMGSELPVWTVESVEGGIAISLDGQYLAYASSTNMKMQDEAYTWTLDEGYVINSASTSRGIYYQISSGKFGAYAKSNATNSGYISGMQLYRYEIENCEHQWVDGICGNCGTVCEHNYVHGICTGCSALDPFYVPNYYLVGYINGANHGCEEDHENMGHYKFVDDKLVVTFDQDSYVFLKTEGNGSWYMTKTYAEGTSAVFYDTKTGAAEKMKVPGGVEITFSLKHNSDDTLTLSYSAPSSVVKPTLTLKSPTLEFKDMITVNAMFTAENLDDVVEMGMITYSSKVDVWNVETADHVIPGTTYDANTDRYIAHSQGIHAKYLGDTVYLACYAKLTDGSYVYTSKLAPYSPVQYATSQLKNSSDMKLKQLVAAMLNYGAEAQLFFGHNTGNLANASLTAEQKALPESYRADMVNAVPSASAEKQGAFANNSGFSKRYPAISFEGAFCINYFFKPSSTPVGDITLYYWNEADYNAASVLTVENASGNLALALEDSGEYRGDILGISAKNLSAAVYVAAVYSDGTTTWTSGVLGYSIGAYCSSQSSKGAAVAALAEATAVYGYHAKAYFG